MSCHFIVIPDGRLPYLVDQHPTPDRIGDALGGAIPVPIWLPRGEALMWVRETARQEYRTRNRTASVLAHVIGQELPQPILGPAVLTNSETIGSLEHNQPCRIPEGFDEHSAARMIEVLADIGAAIGGADDGFTTPGFDPGWAAKIRGAAGQALLTPVPAGWPHVSSAGKPDPVWAAFVRAGFGPQLGRIPVPPVV